MRFLEVPASALSMVTPANSACSFSLSPARSAEAASCGVEYGVADRLP